VNETQDSIQLMDAYGSENLASNDFNEYFYQMGRYIFDELSSNKDVKLYDNTT
jgi:uroporphyrinogen-III decarboxylase